MTPIRVLVVEDHAEFRNLLCLLLQETTECEVVDRPSDGLEAVRKAEELQPDLVLLDLGLPKLNGMEVMRRIRLCSPQTKLLVISQESAPEIVQGALRNGANGYLMKSSAAELPLAVDAVMHDQEFVSCLR